LRKRPATARRCAPAGIASVATRGTVLGMAKMNASYDRPVTATLIVRTEHGEEWEASAEDLRKFGAVPADTVYHRFVDWVDQALATAGVNMSVNESPLNPLRYALECAAYYDHLPDQETADEVADLVAGALYLHLAGRHAAIPAPGATPAELAELHQHEHTGPGTIRNHDQDDFDVDRARAAHVLTEAAVSDATITPLRPGPS